jgi:hypothetical protein
MELRARTRQHVMRVLLGALMDSDLSVSELRELAKNLENSPEFLIQFIEMLRLVLHRLERGVSLDARVPVSNSGEIAVYSAVQRRRLPKSTVLELMEKYSDAAHKLNVTERTTMRELIRKFLEVAKPEEVRGLRRALETQTPRKDPYLEGIVRRKGENLG